VLDQRGAPMAGVTVTFAVVTGGGSLGQTTATTNATGDASSGSWTLGSTAGVQSVIAMAGFGLTGVGFTATAQARVATTVVAASAVTQSATAGAAVPEPPAVIVRDQTGALLAGASVVFGVTGGGGSLVGASATTDAAGRAAVTSWTLGATPGVNTATATAGSAAAVTFTATGTGVATDPCATAAVYTLFAAVAGTLSTSDCDLGGWWGDIYVTSLPSAQGVVFRMNSTELDAWLEMYDAAGDLIAINDDDDAAATTNSAVRVFAPAGSYFLAATSYGRGETGAYQLTSEALTVHTGCLETWIVPGLAISQSISAGDCDYSGYLTDPYTVVLRQGEVLTVRLESTAFDAYLELYDLDGNLLAEDDDGAGGTNSLLTFTAPAYDGYIIAASTFDAGETGAYTLTVTRSGGSASRAPAGAAVAHGPVPSRMLAGGARAAIGGTKAAVHAIRDGARPVRPAKEGAGARD
jgi:hypothetical protein